MRDSAWRPVYFDARRTNHAERVMFFGGAMVASLALWALIIISLAQAI